MSKLIAYALAGAAFLTCSAASAQIGEGDTNLFISPCGEPFTAPRTEAYPIVKWFKRADANGDGKLSIEEMRNDAGTFFKVLDRNGDGVISSAEVTYYEQVIVPVILQPAKLETGIILVDQPQVDPIAPSGAQPGDENIYKPHLNVNEGAVFFSVLREPEPVRSADRNFDYRITLQEFLDHSDRHFKTLDIKENGYITLADLPKTEAEVMSKAHR